MACENVVLLPRLFEFFIFCLLVFFFLFKRGGQWIYTSRMKGKKSSRSEGTVEVDWLNCRVARALYLRHVPILLLLLLCGGITSSRQKGHSKATDAEREKGPL